MLSQLGLLHIRELTKRDVILLGIGAFLSCCAGLAGVGILLLLPFIVTLILIPLVRLIEYILALRVSATTLAAVVAENMDSYRVGHGKYSRLPADHYVVLQPVVEFETMDGKVRVTYPIYRSDRVFLVGEEYEICYSVRNPKIFYFTCRKYEVVKRYLWTLGFWGILVGCFGFMLCICL